MIVKGKLACGALFGGTALRAIALAGAGVAAAIASPAAAQDYTTGAVAGTVVNQDNAPVAGAQVTIRSQAQGQSSTLVASGGGIFTAVGLTPGTYDVIVKGDGYRDYSGTFEVSATQTSRLTLTLVGVNAPSDVVVTGSRVRQDFTRTATGLNVDVPNVLNQVPVARNLTALTLLAPGTIQGAAGFGTRDNAVASIGGSSVAENAYYINGLNITNPDTYVGSARVPFDFYKSVDIQTGGYAAEFGRATGGVINATTKSGTNTAFMAIHGNFLPSLESGQSNTGVASNPDNVGRLARDYDESITIEAGGALVKDHVFLYGLIQPRGIVVDRAFQTSRVYEQDKTNTPYYGGKADVYLTSTQHAEFTFFDTSATTYINRFNFTPNADFTGGTIGAPQGSSQQKTGGFNYVARYTGNVTSFFQLSGAYGVSKDANDVGPGNTSSYYVQDRRTATVGGVTSVISNQTFLSFAVDDTKRRFYRFDGDLRFEALGQHHIRFGLDNEDLSENKTTQIVGGLPIEYSYRNAGVVLTYERLGGRVSGRDRAFYLQDSWTPITGLLVNLGVRDDEFNQRNLSDQQYLNYKGNWAARAGFVYTPNGDSKFSFKGNYGRYFIPPAMNLGFRGKDDYFQEYFSYPAGFTAANFPTDTTTGLPLINFGPARTGVAGFSSACPNDLSSAPGQPINGANTCNVFGSNLQDPAYAKVAPTARATYEDEAILGVRFQANKLISVGLTGLYRSLGRVSEDTDFSQELLDYYGCGTATPTGTAAQCARYALRNTYYIWNPGSSVTLVDWVDATKKVNLTNLPFPNGKRTYEAVVLDWARADDGVWNLAGSFTVSRSVGNYEGTVGSDIGNGVQTDAGSGVAFDYPGLARNSYGILPNDHTFVLKLFGGVHLFHNLYVGGNGLLQSPMHGSCQGYNPTDPDALGYGSISYYCGVGALNADGNYTQSAPSPRGTGWKTDWLKQIDVKVSYTLPEAWNLGKGLTLRADIINVFNSQAITNRNPEHENDSDGTYFTPNPAYRTASAFQQPRYVRFGFDWLF